MKKKHQKRGEIFFLLIFLSLVVLAREAIFKLPNFSFKKSTKKELAVDFYPISPNFRGKINFTCGKIGRKNRLVVTSQVNNFSLVKIFNPQKSLFDEISLDGVRSNLKPLVGDLDGDKKNELVIGDENKGRIFIYQLQGKKFKFSKSFKVLETKRGGGIDVALGDVNGDKKDEIIVGGGQGENPWVKIFNQKGEKLGSFFAFHPKVNFGVKVASLDYDQDKRDEIVVLGSVMTKTEYSLQFKVYKFDKIYSLQAVERVYGKKIKMPVNLFTLDVNDDKKKEIVIVPQKEMGERIKIFAYGKELIFTKKNNLKNIFLFDFIPQNFAGSLALCDLNGNKKAEVIIGGKNSQIKIFYR